MRKQLIRKTGHTSHPRFENKFEGGRGICGNLFITAEWVAITDYT